MSLKYTDSTHVEPTPVLRGWISKGDSFLAPMARVREQSSLLKPWESALVFFLEFVLRMGWHFVTLDFMLMAQFQLPAQRRPVAHTELPTQTLTPQPTGP